MRLLNRKGNRSSDNIALLSVIVLSIVAITILMWPLWTVISRGLPALSLDFVILPTNDAGRSGGIGPIIVSTMAIVSISLLIALPMAFGSAVLITETLSPESYVARIMRCSLDILAGVPSIVFGLFGLTLFCRQLGLGYSILAGGATLACMVLPTLTRSLVAVLQSLGTQFRLAGSALGLSRTTVLWYLTVPAALRGISSAIILAMTRSLAETAVLLFTSGYSDRMPASIMDSGRSISVHIFELSTNVPGGMANAYGSAVALLLLLAIMGLGVHFAAKWAFTRFTGCAP